MGRNIWVWMIYQLNTREIFGAIRRCERAYWTAEQPREELEGLANEMQIDRMRGTRSTIEQSSAGPSFGGWGARRKPKIPSTGPSAEPGMPYGP